MFSQIGALYALEVAQTGDELLEVLDFIAREVAESN